MRTLVLLCCALSIGATTHAPVVSETLATQVALDRAGFSPGEIDGQAGQNLQRALDAFQRAHNLDATGQINDDTWKQLTMAAGDAQPLTTYSITDADLAGPFTTDIPPKLPDEASLDALNYSSPVEELGERFHCSPALLKKLNPKATFQMAGEQITVPNVTPFTPAAASGPSAPTAPAAPSAPARDITVYVTKSTSSLTLEDASGHVMFHAPVTSGSEHDPLPIGTWKVNGVQRNPKFHYNPDLFWDASPGDSKATIQAGPNNPVGVVWIDLSKPHYGIHGTPAPGNIGHVESHGCVRLTNWDAAHVASLVHAGTRVVFRE